MSDICLMSINKIDMVIDKGRYVKHQAWINFLLGVIWQKDIPTKFELKITRGSKLHEDNFAPKINFARVIFLHESKKVQKKKNRKKVTDRG